MTGPTNTVSSTKPIISASALRGAIVAGLAAAASLAAYEACRGVLSAQARAQGVAALAAAEHLPIGPARDTELARAQSIAGQAVDLTPDDADLWNLLAETRLMQATGAAAASEPLLKSAADASIHAATLAPNDPAPPARIAFVHALEEDGKDQVAAPLAKSYAASAFDPSLGQRRVEAAARAWTTLSEGVRAAALGEACQLARTDGQERQRLYKLRMGPAESGMALELDRILADPSCAVPD